MSLDWLALLDTCKGVLHIDSDSQLARLIGVTRSQISNFRHGKNDLGIAQKMRILDLVGNKSAREVITLIYSKDVANEIVQMHDSALDSIHPVRQINWKGIAMLGFVLVEDAMPEDDREVEVIRGVYMYQNSGFCRFTIERTIYSQRLFRCDVVGTGKVLAWQYAEDVGECAAGYPRLDMLPHE